MFSYSCVYDPREERCVHRYNIQDGKEYEELKVIASWGICNTASLNVFKIDNINNRILVAINDQNPEWYSIDDYVDEDWENKELEDDLNLGIKYGNTIYFLDECMKF